jgi:trafficking protein particle complex subunit 9
MVIPVKKFLLPEDVISKPIPTLSERQFVLTKSNLTSEEERTQRVLFWYREELFKSIRGQWREVSLLYYFCVPCTHSAYQVGGTRSGDLSLRRQRLTLPMLETLRTETARVQTSLVRYESSSEGRTLQPVPKRGDKYLPPLNEFVYLGIKVTNLSCESSW